MDQQELGRHYLDNVIAIFRQQKDLAEKAIAQIGEDDLYWAPESESNSIAVVMRHLVGNMTSRWTDFLNSDGEKPSRIRDHEFATNFARDKQKLLEAWERGWTILFSTLQSLQPDDLVRTITIRQRPHTVVEAINRQLSHYGYHVGQIVYLAKALAADNWTTLSIPKAADATAPASTEHDT